MCDAAYCIEACRLFREVRVHQERSFAVHLWRALPGWARTSPRGLTPRRARWFRNPLTHRYVGAVVNAADACPKGGHRCLGHHRSSFSINQSVSGAVLRVKLLAEVVCDVALSVCNNDVCPQALASGFPTPLLAAQALRTSVEPPRGPTGQYLHRRCF